MYSGFADEKWDILLGFRIKSIEAGLTRIDQNIKLDPAKWNSVISNSS